MQSTITLAMVLATVPVAIAETVPINTAAANLAGAVRPFQYGVAHEAPVQSAVARRDVEDDTEQQACIMGVVEELMPPLPENTQIEDWAYQAGEIDKCTVTAPASISSDINSYLSVLTHWYETLEDKAAKQTDCGMSNFTMPLPVVCSTSRTVIFTDSAEATAESTVYPPFPGFPNDELAIGGSSKETAAPEDTAAPQNSDTPQSSDAPQTSDAPKNNDVPKDGAAPRNGEMIALGMALTGLVGVALAL
ncbi:hypothetical protein HJFPF1_13187 [Paramyrothecium foliicola]|nr:hypothetical protein HJFPF1_13187 [Paramyrothecium foliicola]